MACTYLVIDKEEPVSGYEAAILLRHAPRHERTDHDQRVRGPQRILVVQYREAEAAFTFH